MRFQVPQFTEVEDKIIGPLTLKQFIYLGGAAGICAVIYSLVPIRAVAFVLMLPVGIFGGMLAFYRVNNKPFINLVEAFFKYSSTNKLYLWKREPKANKSKKTPSATEASKEETTIRLSENKLKELARNLDIQDSLNSK